MLLLVAITLAPLAADEPLVFVVSKESALTSVTTAELRAAFLGETRAWPDGTPVVPVNLARETPARRAFGRHILGMSADDYERTWLRKKLRGEGAEPRAAQRAAQLQSFVAHTAGAIGYVTLSELSPHVKPLLVDGRAHTDPAYVLKIEAGDR
jgi:ABC-type phosphate transport system substrate-binding protein